MTDVVGLRFVTEGYEDAVARLNEYKKVTTATTDVVKNVAGATRGIESSLKQLNAMYDSGAVAGQAYRRAITELGAQFAALSGKSAAEGRQAILALNQAMEAQRVKTEELAAARQRAETGYALAIQRHREEAAAQQAAAQAKERAKQGYDQLRASIDPVIAAQQRYAEAERRVNAAVQQGIVTREQGNATLAAYRLRLGDLSRTALDADNITGRLRQQFLATANSIAILDGPLGGVASRFSAFGVLIGRTGLLIGTALVGFAALGATLNKSVRIFSEYERSMARINAVLTATGHSAGIAGADIAAMSERIAVSTLSSSEEIRNAAAKLLTFRNVGVDTFEKVLRAATDMAALGFGTVESETVKLAKALEDPAQSLTSLSRSGITFTRAQRSVIMSLVETGYHGEALTKILETVNSQVGGAAQREAETFAGKIDTIGQAFEILLRRFGGAAVGEGTVVGDFLSRTAFQAAQIVEQETRTLAQQRAALEGERKIVEQETLLFAQRMRDAQAAMDAVGAREGRIKPRHLNLLKEYQEARDAFEAAQRAAADLQQQLDALSGQEVERTANDVTNALGRINSALTEIETNARTTVAQMLPTALDVFIAKTLAASQSSDALGKSVADARRELEEEARVMFTIERAARTMSEVRSAVDQTPSMLAAMQAQLEFQGQTTQLSRVQQETRRQELRIQYEITALEALRSSASDENKKNIDGAVAALRAQLGELNLSRVAAEDLAKKLDFKDAVDRGRSALEALVALAAKISSDQLATNQKTVTALQDQIDLARLNIQFGAESIQVRAAEAEIARRLFMEDKKRQGVLGDNLLLVMDMYDEVVRLEAIAKAVDFSPAALSARNMASELRDAAGVLDALLGRIASLGFSNIGRVARVKALERGESVGQARVSGLLAEERARLAPLSGSSDAILRGEAARRIADYAAVLEEELKLDELEKARVAARKAANKKGAEKESATLQSIVRDMEERLVRERELLGLQGRARREREIAIDIEDQLRKAKKSASDEAIQNAAAQIAAYEQVNETLRRQQEELQQISQTMENAMTNAFMSIVDGTKTAEDAFRDMARTIIAELYKVLVVQQLVGSWDAKSNTGTGIVGALMGGLSRAFGSANGNVFTPGMGGPNVIPFARGGVVGSPTLFPMAGGRTGLMGEAGPEAIMPLKRGKDGKLGVQAQGGSTVHIVQNFSVAANGDESVKRIVAQQVPAIAEATKAAVLDARKRGGQMRAAFK